MNRQERREKKQNRINQYLERLKEILSKSKNDIQLANCIKEEIKEIRKEIPVQENHIYKELLRQAKDLHSRMPIILSEIDNVKETVISNTPTENITHLTADQELTKRLDDKDEDARLRTIRSAGKYIK